MLDERREQQLIALIGRVEELEKLLGLPNPSGGGLVESNGSSWEKVDTIPSTRVTIPRHSGKLDDLQDYLNSTQASGKISGGGFTDNTDGTMTVALGAGLIRSANDALDEVEFFSWIENDNVTLTDESTNYIIVTHGSPPVVSATVTKTDGNNRNVILLGKVFREATVLHMVEAGMLITEVAKNVLTYLTQVHGEVVRASGYAVAESGERYLTTTNGVLFGGLTRITTTGIDTTGADTFETYYYDGDLGTPAWVEGTASQIDNANWNDVATGLDTLTSNRYGVHWVYGDPDGHLMVVYGQGDYTLINANLANPPSSLPDHVADFGFLAAKIVVQEGEANLYSIESAYDTLFTPGGAADHGELAGLADDDHSAYLLDTGDQMDGALIIDGTTTEALLVRKDADGGDVLIVDTTNARTGINTTPSYPLHVVGATVITGTTTFTGTLTVRATADYIGLVFNGFDDQSAEYIAIRHTAADGQIITSGKLIVQSLNSEDIAITSANDVIVTGDAWFNGDVSALTFTDRTPFYDGDALKEIKEIKGKDGEIDHATLPEFVQVKRKKNVALKKLEVIDGEFEDVVEFKKGDNVYHQLHKLEKDVDYEEIEVTERSLGNMISVLTKAVQELADKVEN